MDALAVSQDTWVLMRRRFLGAGGAPHVRPELDSAGNVIVPIEAETLERIRAKALPGEDAEAVVRRLLWRLRP